MIPVGNYIEIEPIEEDRMLIMSKSAYQAATVKQISADVQVPFVVGGLIYFVRGKIVYLPEGSLISIDFVELYKK